MELIDSPQQEPEVKRHWFNDPDKIRLLAAILTIGAAAVNAFGRSQKATWVLLAGIGVLFLSLVVPVVVRRIRERSLSMRNKHLVEREHKKLERFFEKFARLCLNRNDSRTFLYILYDSAKFQNHVVRQIIGSDFMPSWTGCFASQLQTPCRELKPFLARCREFCVIVRQFNQEYVIKAQRGLDEVPRMSATAFAELESFREEFAQFLRDAEEWIDALNKEANQQLTTAEQLQHGPFAHFERAKPFVWKSLGAKNAAQ
jgi:hypothetical protein